MKTKLSLLTLFTCATIGTSLFADVMDKDYSYADLCGETFSGTIKNVNFSHANLSEARFLCSSYCIEDVDFSHADLTNAMFRHSGMSNVKFVNANLEGVQSIFNGACKNADFTSANLRMANFSSADFSGSVFLNANLTEAGLYCTELSGCNFTGAIVKGARFNGSTLTLEQLYSTQSYSQDKDLSGTVFGYLSAALDLSSGDFSGINLTDAYFQSTTLKDAKFASANLTNADFTSSVATGASFAGANLTNAIFASSVLTGASFRNADLTNVDFSGATLAGVDFSIATIAGANFKDTDVTFSQLSSSNGFNWTGICLSGLNLEGANLSHYCLDDADLSETKLAGAYFWSTSLRNANLSGANLKGIEFRSGDLFGTNFTDAILTRAHFYGEDLENANFTGADLTDANFDGTNITGSNFNGSNFTKEQLLSTRNFNEGNLSGVGLSGMDLSANEDDSTEAVNFSGFNLTNADLSKTTLTGVDFSDAIIKGANFSGSDFTADQLYSTASYNPVGVKDLSGINLSHLDLTGADFSSEEWEESYVLSDSNFSHSILYNADFSRANLANADFSNAEFLSAYFGGAIINGADFSRDDDSDFQWQFTIDMLRYTASYMNKDLSGVGLRNIYLAGEDFSDFNLAGVNLEGASLYGATLHGTNLQNSNLTDIALEYVSSLERVDFRGSVNQKEEYDSENPVYSYSEDYLISSLSLTSGNVKNLILSDGKIFAFSMESPEDSFSIKEHLPQDGEASIPAKLTESVTISGGAVLTLEENAVLEILGENTLTIGDSSSVVLEENTKLHFSATDESASSIVVSNGGSITFSATTSLVIDFTGMFADELTFSVITGETGSIISGLNTENISLIVNGESYDTSLWNVSAANGSLSFTVQASDLTDLIEITSSYQDVVLKYDGVRGVFSSDVTTFYGTISGEGSLYSSKDLMFGGDASAFSGTTEITAGTFTIAESAKLGTGTFNIAGTLLIDGTRTFDNVTSGTGSIDIASGTVTFLKNIGTATFNISENAEAKFSGASNGFSGKLTGSGTLSSTQDFVLSGDASAFSGKTSVSAGTFTVAESAKLGTGAFDVAGTLALNGDRTFSNTTSGDGKLEVASGTATITTDIGTKTFSVAENAVATLDDGADLTHSEAEAQITGTLTLNGDRDFSATLSGNGTLATNGNVAFTSDASAFSGKTSVTAGTLTVAESAKLGTGAFDITGTLLLNGTRTFSNTTSGDGKLEVASGTATITTDIGTKTFSVAENAVATLDDGADLTHSEAEAQITGTLTLNGDRDFSTTLSGNGTLATNGEVAFASDASAFSGKTSVTAGTFTVAEAATLGTGAFDVAGTLALNGNRTFSNTTSGDGKLEVASGSTLITTDIGTKTFSVSENATATLSDGINLAHSEAEAQITGFLALNGDRDFSAMLSGNGTLATNGNVTFASDASAFSGKTSVTAGTLTVAEAAKLGTGAFDVAGTLTINGTRTFSNATSGTGKFILAPGSTVSFGKPVGVKTLSVSDGAILCGSVDMTYGTESELTLAGTLVLNTGSGEKISLGGGKITIADSAKLAIGKNSPYHMHLASEAIAGLEDNKEVVLIENGTLTSNNITAFLSTDADLLAYSKRYAVVYDTTGGLKVWLVKDLSTPMGGVDLNGLSSSFTDWILSGTDATLLEFNRGFIDTKDFGGTLSDGNDPLLKALLGGDTETARSILDRLSSKSYAAMVAMPTEAFNSDVRNITSRLEQHRREDFTEGMRWDFFAQAQINSVKNDTTTDSPSFDFNTTGVFAGGSYRLNKELTLGMALGTSTGKAEIHNNGGDIESMDFRLTGFIGKSFEKYFVNAGAQVGYASYDVTRSTEYGNACGDTSGWSAGLFADAGMVFTLSDAKKIYATPYIGFSYMRAQANAFDENGCNKAFAVDEISGDSLRTRIGCAFTWDFALADATWHVGLDLAYSHDFIGEEVDIDVTAQSGDKITETAKALPESMLSLSPTLSVDLTPSASVYGGYSFSAGSDSSANHSANIGFRMRF